MDGRSDSRNTKYADQLTTPVSEKLGLTHMSPLINSSRSSTFRFASPCSCGTSTGPTSLYTVLFGVSDANSYVQSSIRSALFTDDKIGYGRRTFFTSSSLSSSAGSLLDTIPSTTDLFGGNQRRGSKVPARSVSYSSYEVRDDQQWQMGASIRHT